MEQQPVKKSMFSGYRLIVKKGYRDANGVYRQRPICSSYYDTEEELFKAMMKHDETWLGKEIRIIYNR